MENEQRKLTVNDPVEQETLSRIEKIQNARLQLADQLLDIEQQKVRILRAASNLDAERIRIFEDINMTRGLSPNAPVEIDAKTGKITPIPVQGVSEEG